MEWRGWLEGTLVDARPDRRRSPDAGLCRAADRGGVRLAPGEPGLAGHGHRGRLTATLLRAQLLDLRLVGATERLAEDGVEILARLAGNILVTLHEEVPLLGLAVHRQQVVEDGTVRQ